MATTRTIYLNCFMSQIDHIFGVIQKKIGRVKHFGQFLTHIFLITWFKSKNAKKMAMLMPRLFFSKNCRQSIKMIPTTNFKKIGSGWLLNIDNCDQLNESIRKLIGQHQFFVLRLSDLPTSSAEVLLTNYLCHLCKLLNSINLARCRTIRP